MNLIQTAKNIFNVKEVSKLNADLTTAIAGKDTELTTLKAEVADYKQTIAAFGITKETWDTDMAKVKADYEAKIQALTEEKNKVSVSVHEEVAVKVASMGIPAETIKETISSELSFDSALATLKGLQGKQRIEYFNKNKGLLTQARHSLINKPSE